MRGCASEATSTVPTRVVVVAVAAVAVIIFAIIVVGDGGTSGTSVTATASTTEVAIRPNRHRVKSAVSERSLENISRAQLTPQKVTVNVVCGRASSDHTVDKWHLERRVIDFLLHIILDIFLPILYVGAVHYNAHLSWSQIGRLIVCDAYKAPNIGDNLYLIERSGGRTSVRLAVVYENSKYAIFRLAE